MRRLKRSQIAEIVAFDHAARCGSSYDERRYGSVTNVADLPARGGLNFGVANIRGGWGMPCNLAYTLSPGVAEAAEKAKKSGMPTRKTLRYNYVDVLPKGRDGVSDVEIVHVAVRLDRALKPVVKDVARISLRNGTVSYRDLGYHGLGGWIVYWNRSDYETKAVRSWSCPPALGEWVTEKLGRSPCMTFPWHQTVNPCALADTRYKYCQYEPDHGIGIIKWLLLYRAEPRVEALAKAGLHELITPAGLAALKDRRVFAWVREHAEEIRNGSTVREILWAVHHGCDLLEANRHFAFVDEMRVIRDRDWPRLDYVRLRKLVVKCGVKACEYANYLRQCTRAGLDLRNEGTLYPPTSGGREAFMDRLERLEREGDRLERNARRRRERANAKRAREEAGRAAELMKERIPEIDAFQKVADRVLRISGESYRIVLAKSQEELLAEGKKMCNCVGDGTYGRGIVDGRCLIVMVRDEHGSPYVDIEIDRASWKVRQCYTRHNHPAPENVYQLAKALAVKFRQMSKRRKAS